MHDKEKVVLDTSVIIQCQKFIEKVIDENEYELIIPDVVARELDNMKESDGNRRAFNGRNGLRFIKRFENTFIYVETENMPLNDDSIIKCARDNKALIATKDMGMWIKCKTQNIEILDIEESEDDVYLGYSLLEVDTSDENQEEILASVYDGTFDYLPLHENEYLIIKDTSIPLYDMEDGKEKFIGYKTVDIKRYTQNMLVGLRYVDNKLLKPMNDLQKCAIDLLMNDDVPIKILAGGFGSGKTFLSTKIALHRVKEKGDFGSILMLRNPLVEGENIGYLPGSKEEKTVGFFSPFVQHLNGGEQEAISLEQQGILKKDIIGYIKGLSIGSTYVLIDEAEDLNMKQLKMCGSRIEETSSICFMGDYKQTHDKYMYNTGLMQLIEDLKNNKYSGTIVLEEDLRSPASKVFADL